MEEQCKTNFLYYWPDVIKSILAMPVLVIGYVLCNIQASECSNKVEFQGKKEELFETKSSLALGRCSILKLEAEAIERHAIYPVFRPLGIIGGFPLLFVKGHW